MQKFFSLLMIMALLLPVDCFARPGGSSGGGRSGGFSSSRSSSFSSSRSSAPKPSATPSKSGGFSTTKSPTTTSSPTTTGFSSQSSSVAKPQSKPTPVDLKTTKMVKVGNQTMSKDQAVADFKTKHASTYTSKFSSEPAKRPAHIPTTTTVGNTNVNVSYNSQYGGYGYMHPTLGTWMMYDVMSDMAMASMLMNNHGYVAHAPVVASPVVYSTGQTIAGWILFTIFLCCIGVILLVMIKAN
jgi:hypothetical protein